MFTARLLAVLSIAALTFQLNAQAPARKAPAEDLAARAARIHKEAIVVDTHIDTTQMLGREGWDFFAKHEPPLPGAPRGEGARGNHVDLPRMRDGGLDAAFFSIYMAGTI